MPCHPIVGHLTIQEVVQIIPMGMLHAYDSRAWEALLAAIVRLPLSVVDEIKSELEKKELERSEWLSRSTSHAQRVS